LQELEDRMLRLLREAGGSLLDDEVLLGTLNNSRSTSAAINVRVAEAQATEASINAARGSYRPAAARASTLYFVVSGLSAIDSMCALAHAAWCSACTACACHGH
jgi:dynein heavy chain